MGEIKPWVKLLIAVLTLAACAACAGQSSRVGIAPVTLGLPWPPPDSPKRSSTDIATIAGSDFDQSGGGAVPAGLDLVMGPGEDISWAIYSLAGNSGSTGGGYASIAFSFSQPQPRALYLGVANYQIGAWEWFEATPPECMAVIDDLAPYVSPQGNIHAAVVQQGSSTVTLSEVTIARLGMMPPPPQGLEATIVGADIELSWDSVRGAAGYTLYRSKNANMSSAVKVNPALITDTVLLDSTALPLTTYYYAVSCTRGDESPRSAALQVESPAENLGAPQNLSATTDVGIVHLSWDPVVSAKNYIVYRADNPDFISPSAVGVPLSNSFDNNSLPWDKIYYYKVAAKRNAEGPLSEILDVHVPGSNLPMPQNFRVESLDGDTVVMAWDYDFPDDIAGFRIYFGYTKDFSFDGNYYHYKQINDPSRRSYMLQNIPPLTKLYCRVAAFDNVGRGRATDDISFSTEDRWTWGPVEEIGDGGHIPHVIPIPGGLACVQEHNTAIELAERLSGIWTVYPTGLDPVTGEGGFAEFVDVSYGGGKYCVVSQTAQSRDLWAATGVPGNWDLQRVHGDGKISSGSGDTQGPPPSSGNGCQVRASATEFGIIHYDSTLDKLLFHSSPLDTTVWSPGSQIATNLMLPIHFSMATDGTNFLACLLNTADKDLLFGSSADAWAWQDIAGVESTLGGWLDMEPYATGWITPAIDQTSFDFLSLQGFDGSAIWSPETVESGVGECRYARLAVSPSQIMMVYRTELSPRWYYSVYDGTSWQGAAVLVDGYLPGNSIYGEITFLDETPCFFFQASDKLVCVPGIPPA